MAEENKTPPTDVIWNQVQVLLGKIRRATNSSYTIISGNDSSTDVTGAELEELTDGSTTTLHNHGYSFSVLPGHGLSTAVSTGATVYVPFFYYGLNATSYNLIVPRAGIIKNLLVRTLSSQPGTGTLVFTVLKGGAPTAITTTVTAGGGAGDYTDTSNTVSLLASDTIIIAVTNNAATNSATIGACVLEYGTLVSAT